MVMTLQITPLHPHIGAAVSGLDVSRPIDDSAVAALWQAIDSHAVLVFRDQQITDEQLRSFAARFGELEIGRSAARGGRRRLQFPEIGDISNLDEDNRLRARDDRRRLDSLGNRLWHTDASYMPVPVVLGMLFAVAVPPASPFGAGETEFADMRAAYDALSDAQRAAGGRMTRISRAICAEPRPSTLARPSTRWPEAHSAGARASAIRSCRRPSHSAFNSHSAAIGIATSAKSAVPAPSQRKAATPQAP